MTQKTLTALEWRSYNGLFDLSYNGKSLPISQNNNGLSFAEVKAIASKLGYTRIKFDYYMGKTKYLTL